MKGILAKLKENRMRKQLAKIQSAGKELQKQLEEEELLQKQKAEKEALQKRIAEEKAKLELDIPPEKPEEPKEVKTGLSNQIKEISEKLDNITQEKVVKEKLKKKTFKLPYKVKSQLRKLALKSKVQVLLLQNNGNIKPIIATIKDGMLIIGEKFYDGNPKGLWFWNGKFPTMIVPEWDLRPLSRESLYNDAAANKRLSDPQTIIIRAMEMKEALQGKTISSKVWIFGGIGAIIVFYVLFAGG